MAEGEAFDRNAVYLSGHRNEGLFAVISLEHVSAAYQTETGTLPVLSNIDLQIPEGGTCALIGPSGCGKSTLLKIAAGILPHGAGRVLFRGSPLHPAKHIIGFMPQNYGLLPWKTARDNILLGCRIKGELNEERERALLALCERLRIEALLDRYPHELSGGQQQRVSLARVFLLAPDILLMDEPFSALDAITREEMQEVFLDLWRSQSVTTLLVTHYVEEALYLGERIVLMPRCAKDGIEVLHNPLAGDKEKRMRQAFFAESCALREQIRRMGRA